MKILFTRRLLAGLLLITFLGVDAVAQTNNPYKVSTEQVRELVHKLDERSESYRSLIDILLEISRLDGTPREEHLELLVHTFEREVDALEARVTKGVSTVADVERVLHAAVRVDAPLTSALSDPGLSPDRSLRERAQTEWELLKSSLNNLADFYNIEWDWKEKREKLKSAEPL